MVVLVCFFGLLVVVIWIVVVIWFIVFWNVCVFRGRFFVLVFGGGVEVMNVLFLI